MKHAFHLTLNINESNLFSGKQDWKEIECEWFVCLAKCLVPWCWCKLHVCWGGVGAASLPWVCESLLAGCRHHGTASAAAAAARPGGLGASSSSGSIWWRAGGAFRACYLPQRLHQHGARLR